MIDLIVTNTLPRPREDQCDCKKYHIPVDEISPEILASSCDLCLKDFCECIQRIIVRLARIGKYVVGFQGIKAIYDNVVISRKSGLLSE